MRENEKMRTGQGFTEFIPLHQSDCSSSQSALASSVAIRKQLSQESHGCPPLAWMCSYRVPFMMNSYTSIGTSVSRQHPRIFTKLRWLSRVRMATSLMNCSICFSSTVFDLLMATTRPSDKDPLYTALLPPFPIIWSSSKFFVATLNCSIENISVSSMLSLSISESNCFKGTRRSVENMLPLVSEAPFLEC
ncbi:hypothetical protein AKJ16_DCAP22399 [Drosera capensis]